jgi:3-hydroxybutyryl-CoA dehydrogenase
MEIRKVGVVGCGQMGSGIALVCAQSGYRVMVSEISTELLKKGLDSINSALNRSVDKGRLSSQEMTDTINRIKGTTSLQDFSTCDLVIEAAVEDLEIKRKIMAELDVICPSPAILSSNTSCLSVTALAQVTSRKDRVAGLHFFNPVPQMKLVEIARTPETSHKTIEAIRNFAGSLGKKSVIVQDTPGFIINRLSVPFLLNAIRLLESGVAAQEDIDTAVNLGLNHPMGPLALADLIGLDVLLSMANTLHQALQDQQYVAPQLLKEKVSRGTLGRKTGSGFYEYR